MKLDKWGPEPSIISIRGIRVTLTSTLLTTRPLVDLNEVVLEEACSQATRQSEQQNCVLIRP